MKNSELKRDDKKQGKQLHRSLWWVHVLKVKTCKLVISPIFWGIIRCQAALDHFESHLFGPPKSAFEVLLQKAATRSWSLWLSGRIGDAFEWMPGDRWHPHGWNTVDGSEIRRTSWFSYGESILSFYSSQSILILFCSPTAECYGVFAQYRFRCALGELGRFWEGTGFREPVPESGSRFRWVPTGSGAPRSVPGTGSGFRWVRSCEGSRFQRLRSPGLESCRFFEGFRGSGFRWVPRFRRFGVLGFDGFWWVLTVSKVSVISGFDGVPKVLGPRAAEDMWDQVLAIWGLAQWGWQCCAESECICVKRNC